MAGQEKVTVSDSDLPDFPRLTWKELRYLTLGIYQFKQSQSYTLTYTLINRGSTYSLCVNREDSSVVQFQLRSRLTSSNVYNIRIRTDIGHNPNMKWYCQCKVESRVVGCCVHIASVLWYLVYWRHNHTQTKTPSLIYAYTIQAAATGWSSDDSASENKKEV
ncbi:uncharacterized protein TNCV_2119261 [Trichonephila clavipes]|nr:uncharacterized protein TNCV_2119261 [Trichonephila clavipes]